MHARDETGGTGAAGAADGGGETRSGRAPGESDEAAAESEDSPPFGSQEPTRYAADVSYRGRIGEHDYRVHVRHRLLDTSFTVEIDGVTHDPKAEEKARKQRGKDERQQTEATGEEDQDEEGPGEEAPEPDLDPVDDAHAAPFDDLQFRVEERFTVLYCTVRRADEDGDHEDAEVITVRTAGLGGAGEVDVRRGLTRRPLAPDEDSPSAARDRKRTAHPTRYALLAAVTRAAAFLIPLLGIGALFSGILRPVREWVAGVVSVVVEAVMGVVDPVLERIDELLRPIREFVDELTRPVREFLDSLLQPVRDLLSYLRDLLRGLLDGLALPFDVPGWVVDVAVPVIVVLVVFAVTFRSLRTRHRRLEAARASSAPHDPGAPGHRDGETADGPEGSREGASDRDEDASDREEGPREGASDRDAPSPRPDSSPS